MRRRTLALALAASLLLPAVAGAHHSGAMNDMNKVVVLKGVVQNLQWSNPHVIIWLVGAPEGAAAGEAQTWTIGLTSPGNLTRIGWTRHSLNVGDKVTMEINPLRSGEHGGLFRQATLPNGQTLTARTLDFEKGAAEPK